MVSFFRDRRGDLVWSALVLVTVLLPLAGLALDLPRYYVLRSRLQLAADATAQAVAGCVDIPHFQHTGETRIQFWCYMAERSTFASVVGDLQTKGHYPVLDRVSIDEGQDAVTVQASGATRLFFGLTPAVRVHVTARSRFRMDVR